MGYIFIIYPYFYISLEIINIKGFFLFINNLVSISEANQNFSKAARLVDENGAAVILKNNVPRYVLIEYGQLQKEEILGDEEIDEVAKRVLSKHMKIFEKLAK